MALANRLVAEVVGTFWLVLGGFWAAPLLGAAIGALVYRAIRGRD